MRAILKKFPTIEKAYILDLPEVIEEAKKALETEGELLLAIVGRVLNPVQIPLYEARSNSSAVTSSRRCQSRPMRT